MKNFLLHMDIRFKSFLSLVAESHTKIGDSIEPEIAFIAAVESVPFCNEMAGFFEKTI